MGYLDENENENTSFQNTMCVIATKILQRERHTFKKEMMEKIYTKNSPQVLVFVFKQKLVLRKLREEE